MERFRIYFSFTSPTKDKFMRWTIGIAGILYISIYIALYYSKSAFSDPILVLLGIASVIYAIGYRKLIQRAYIDLNDSGINARFQKLKAFADLRSPEKVEVKWNEIESVKLRVLKLQLNLNGGKIKEIALSGLLYEQHQLMKDKLGEFLSAKNIILIDEASTQIEQEIPQQITV